MPKKSRDSLGNKGKIDIPMFEDTSARAIEHLHGFEEGRDARVFARMNSEGEGEIHIVGADAEARAAIKAVIETARKVHVVEHEIALPTHEDDVDDDADSSSVRPGRGARRRTGGEP